MSPATKVAKKKTGKSPAKRAKKPVRASAASRRRVDRSTSSGMMPGWAGLAGPCKPRSKKRRAVATGFIDAISTRRFVFIVLAIVGACTLYIGHVHATQALLSEVQHQRKLNHNLNLKYNRLKGEFDRMTGPSAVYSRARELGLQEDVAFGPTIRID